MLVEDLTEQGRLVYRRVKTKCCLYLLPTLFSLPTYPDMFPSKDVADTAGWLARLKEMFTAPGLRCRVGKRQCSI